MKRAIIVGVVLCCIVVCGLGLGCKLGTSAVYVESYGTDANALRAALAATSGDVIVGAGVTIALCGETVYLTGNNRTLRGEGTSIIQGGVLMFGDYDTCRNFTLANLSLKGVGNTGPILDMAENAAGHAAYECTVHGCLVRGSITVRNTVMLTLTGIRAQNEDPNGYVLYADGDQYINSLNIRDSRFLGRCYVNALGAVNIVNSILEGPHNPILEVVRAGGGQITGTHFETTAPAGTCLVVGRYVFGMHISGNILSQDDPYKPHVIVSGRSVVLAGNVLSGALDGQPHIHLTPYSWFCDVGTNFAGFGWLTRTLDEGHYNTIWRAQ